MATLVESFDLFPILFAKYNISGYDEEKDVIESILHDSTLKEHGQLRGNAKTTITAHNRDVLEEYSTLRNKIQAAVDMYTERSGLVPLKAKGSWYSLYENGGHINRHYHPNSQVSGAYYPYVESNYTSIVFENPTIVLRPTDMWHNTTKYTENAKEIAVQAGDLILFPSWVYHFTDPNISGKRCVISFNTQFRGD